MPYKMVSATKPIALRAQILGIIAENHVRVANGEEPFTIMYEFWDFRCNPDDLMGIYDILTLTSGVEIECRMMGLISIFQMVIMSAIGKEKCHISESAEVYCHELGGFAWGPYSELKAVTDEIERRITEAYTVISIEFPMLTEELLRKAAADKERFGSTELLDMGCKKLERMDIYIPPAEPKDGDV